MQDQEWSLSWIFLWRLPSKTTRSHLLLRKEEIRANIWPEVWHKFVKMTRMPNSAKSLGHIKCYSSGSPRPVKNPKICSWWRRLKIILEIKKKTAFLYVINNPIVCKFFKDFTKHRKKTNGAVGFFCCRPFSNILKDSDYQRNFPIIRKTGFLQRLIEKR